MKNNKTNRTGHIQFKIAYFNTSDLPQDFLDYIDTNGIKLDQVSATIEVIVTGYYIPATRLQPAEEPDIEVNSVNWEGAKDVVEVLNNSPESIYQSVLDYFQTGESGIVNTALDSAMMIDEPDEDEVRYRRTGKEY